MPEYGSWMLEGTPKVPLRGLTTHLARVERNMRLRRKRLLATLDDDEIAPTVRISKMLTVIYYPKFAWILVQVMVCHTYSSGTREKKVLHILLDFGTYLFRRAAAQL